MTDIETAVKNLGDHTLALCKCGKVITSDKRGVAPMVDFIRDGVYLSGYSAADKVVGKAAAMLFIKAGIKEIYAGTLSKSAKALLDSHDISYYYTELTERIVNRDKTGLCPMESTVSDTDDIENGVKLIFEKLDTLRAKN